MGNNHDKFFSKDKRKLLIIGLQGSGKSTLVKTLNKGTYQADNMDLNITDIKISKQTLCVFDMGGSDRQRIFWRQNFYGSQGVIYVIDPNKDVEKSLQELEKVVQDNELGETPIAVFMNIQDHNEWVGKIGSFVEELKVKYTKKKLNLFDGQSIQLDSVMKCIEWLGKEMKPI
ncbi:hypothetical protein pb186bvf_013214 [Paramecium bursaria]